MAKKIVSAALSLSVTGVPALRAAECGDPLGSLFWQWYHLPALQKIALPIGAALGLVFLVAAYAALLVLIKSVAPKFTENCRRSILRRPWHNLSVGLTVIGVWVVAAAHFGKNKGDETSSVVLVLLLLGIVLWSIKMFGGAAMCQIIGEKFLKLCGGKKKTSVPRDITVGLTIIMFAIVTPFTGPIAFLILASIELGAVIRLGLGRS